MPTLNSIMASMVEMQSGGPGSGRHAEQGVLKKYGWEVAKKGENTTQFKHKDFPGHRVVMNNNSGAWSHHDVRSPEPLGSGNTPKDLNTHLHDMYDE